MTTHQSTIRLPEDLWRYLKQLSMDINKPMNEIIIALIRNHKNNSKKILTDLETVVSYNLKDA